MLLMTKSDEIKERLLDALQLANDWMAREEIAESIGKNRLNPSDLKHLEGLVETGQVERKTEIVGITPKYLYRLER